MGSKRSKHSELLNVEQISQEKQRPGRLALDNFYSIHTLPFYYMLFQTACPPKQKMLHIWAEIKCFHHSVDIF